MKLYIYNVDTKEIIAIAEGSTNDECEQKTFEYLGVDEYGGSYTNAELIDNNNIIEL
ncbi:hypothetical protein [Pseudoalteromonas sp.]|uniref:hypothetical protein n=1 Tax=Pseudoalteromonas sp. TaxID=53249 RepID=UPI0026101B06|nr:hypothetical protein [Pseudoalteromonas sp.]MCP4585355.1 hypothetical protein [Pseudoalteromonas sp.]